jgi:hypothetical protein
VWVLGEVEVGVAGRGLRRVWDRLELLLGMHGV